MDLNTKADHLARLNALVPISPTACHALAAACTLRTAAKGEIVTPEGAVQHDMLFMLEGIHMSYCDVKDKQKVIAFTYAPFLSGVPQSFLTQAPSAYILQSMTDSRYLALPHSHLQQLYRELPELERAFRLLAELLVVGALQQILELKTLTIEERFRHFAARSPHLLREVPHRYLASYLDMDPTNFSKLYNSIRI